MDLKNEVGQLRALSVYVQIKLSLESQIQSSMKGQSSSAADAFLAFMQQALAPVQGQPNLKQSFAGASLYKSAQQEANVVAGAKAQAFSKRKQQPAGAPQSDGLISNDLLLDPRTPSIQTLVLSPVTTERAIPTQANIGFASDELKSAAQSTTVAPQACLANDSVANSLAQNRVLGASGQISESVGVQNDSQRAASVSTNANVASGPNGAVAGKTPQIDFSEISKKASLTEDVSKEVVRPETSSIKEIKARDLASAQSAAVNTGGISKIDVSGPSIQASLMEDVRNHGGQVEILRTKSNWVQSAGTVKLPSTTDSNSVPRWSGEASAAQEPITNASASNSKVVAQIADVVLDGVSATASNTVPVVPVPVQKTNDGDDDVSAAIPQVPGTAVRPAGNLSHDSLKAAVNAQLSDEMSRSLPQSAKQTTVGSRAVASNGAIKPRTATVTTNAPSHVSAKAKSDSAQPRTKTDSTPFGAANDSFAEPSPSVPTERHEAATTVPAPGLQEATASVNASRGHAFGNGKEPDAADVARAQVLAETTAPDSKAAPVTHSVGSVQAARLVQTLRESQLQVGLHAGEFGKISIHTSMDQNHIAARIYVEHEELGKVIAGSLPELHEKLEVQHRLDAQLELYNTGADQSDRQQHEQYERTTQNFRMDRDSSDPEPQIDTPQQLQSVATTVGLDMHV